MNEEVCRIIAEALEVKRVTPEDNVDTVEGWDSLGTLNVLMALEKRYGPKVASISDLAQVRSVKEILDLLKREAIIT